MMSPPHVQRVRDEDGSATGRAVVELARRRGMDSVAISREWAAQDNFLSELEKRAADLQATAVFDGVGGGPTSRILPALPRKSRLYCHGFLAGQEPLSFPTALMIRT